MQTKPPVIVANWKMHKTLEEAQMFIEALGERLDRERPTVIIAAASVHLHPLHEHAKRHGFHLCAQNIHHEESGAYTGEVSIAMIKEVVTYVLVGHSERRLYAGETAEHARRKLAVALRHDRHVILCVGDDDGIDAEAFVRNALSALGNVGRGKSSSISIMIEPTWAISSFRDRKEITDAEWKKIFTAARLLRGALDESGRKEVDLLYGGSITPENTDVVFGEGIFHGCVPGNASLDVEKFARICEKAVKVIGSLKSLSH